MTADKSSDGEEKSDACSVVIPNAQSSEIHEQEYNQKLHSHNPMNYSNHYSVTIRVTHDTLRDLIGNKHAAAQSLPRHDVIPW